MEINIPRRMGVLKEAQNLRDRGVNIILAADRHDSYLAQHNITAFYLLLARDFGLSTISIEGNPHTLERESNEEFPEPESTAFQANFLRLFSKQKKHPLLGLLTEEPILSSGGMIMISAQVMGYTLDIVQCRSNEDAENLGMACLGYMYRDMRVKRLQLGRPLNRATRQYFKSYKDEALSKVLDAAADMKDRLQADFPDKAERVNSRTSRALVKNLYKRSQFLRTEEQLQHLVDYMQQKSRSLGLMCMGSDHQKDFIALAQRMGLGSAIFIPRGQNVSDPELNEAMLSVTNSDIDNKF